MKPAKVAIASQTGAPRDGSVGPWTGGTQGKRAISQNSIRVLLDEQHRRTALF
jgi:hypothetical protein